MLKSLDDWIIGLFTKMCHRIQEWTGYTNWTVAAVGTSLAMGQCLLCIMRWLWPKIPPTNYPEVGWYIPLDFYLLVCMTREIQWALNNERRLYDGKLPVLDFKLSNYGFRTMWVVFLCMDMLCALYFLRDPWWPLDVFHQVAFPLGQFITSYAICVVPRPPGQNKVREFLESFSRRPVPVRNN